MGDLDVIRAGTVAYSQAWIWQRGRAESVRTGDAPEALLLLQHLPVYTLGMRGRTASVLASDAALAARGAEVVQSDRGGDVTFHGPGQLVAYPILDLQARGLGSASYVRMLEQCVIDTLEAFGVTADRVAGRPGVWASGGDGGDDVAKVAAVGVRIRHGVSTHGVALNVSTDLAWFDAIVPCGIADAGVTSMARLLGDAPAHEAVEDAFLDAFGRVFHVTQRAVAAEVPQMEVA